MSQRRRALLFLGIVSLAAVGCELVVDFDRTKIDGGEIEEVDGSTEDVEQPDVVGQDVNHPDTSQPDAGHDSAVPDGNVPDTNVPDANDANVPDTNVPDAHDANVPDTNVPDAHDANVPDTNVPDTNVPDTNVPDTNVPDTNVPDTNVPDTNVPDTNVPDTDVPDTDVPDTDVPDTNVPDTNAPDTSTACNALDPSSVTPVTIKDVTTPAPTLNGGTFPTTGTWFLTDDTYYVGVGGSSGHDGQTTRIVAEVNGTIASFAIVNSAAPTVVTNANESLIPSTGNGVTITLTCPVGPSAAGMFEVSGTAPGATLIITSDGIQYQTYTLQ